MSSLERNWVAIIERVAAGEDRAALDLWEAYGPRLSRLAEQRLAGDLKRRVGPSDIVNSAYRTFLRHAEAGDYEFANDDALWRLLREITLNKARQHIRFHLREKRSVNREANHDDDSEESQPINTILPDSYPTPEAIAEAIDLRAHLDSLLDDEEQRVLELKLAGSTVKEIVSTMQSSERTVGRITQRIREKLGNLTADSE